MYQETQGECDVELMNKTRTRDLENSEQALLELEQQEDQAIREDVLSDKRNSETTINNYIENERCINSLHQKRIEGFSKEFQLLKKEIEMLRRANGYLTSSKLQIEKELLKLKNELYQCKEMLQMANIQKDILAREKNFLSELNKKLQNDINNLQSKESLLTVPKVIENFTKKFEDWKKMDTENCIELRYKMNDEIVMLKAEIENLKLNNAKDSTQELIYQLSEISSQLKEKIGLLQVYQKELVSEKKKRLELEEKVLEQENNHKIAEENLQLKDRIKFLEEKLKEIGQNSADTTEKDKELGIISEENQNLLSKIDKLKNDSNSLKQQLGINLSQIKIKDDEIENYKNDLKKKENELNDLKAENENIKATSIYESNTLKNLVSILHKTMKLRKENTNNEAQ
ncbi:unnamed protein product [Blepharisma stoltei]|uniref:Uncharacterized protein n=1 Tax=Blepharisma stoltei TaxID=1481888 RepID=A0AAU9J7V2_9CILI|nr:unnamed protein product [Blepharisma stoltei]